MIETSLINAWMFSSKHELWQISTILWGKELFFDLMNKVLRIGFNEVV